MEDEPDGWPYGEEDTDTLTEEQIGYTSERVGGIWTLTVLCYTEHGGEKVTSAWTPFQEESEEAVIQAATRRWPELKVVPQHEWDQVFFKFYNKRIGGRPSSLLGGKGKRVAAERGAGYRPRNMASQGSPGLSAAGLPEDWGRGTRARSVSAGRSGSQGTRPRVDAESLKAFPLDEWVPIVQCAKRLGYPPQYLYNVVYHGKMKTQGERPKRLLWRDVLARYRPEILKEVE